MNEACAAGILADLRNRLENQKRERGDEDKFWDAIAKANELLANLDFWKDEPPSAVLAKVEGYLRSVDRATRANPVFLDHTDETLKLRARLYTLSDWTLRWRAWLEDEILNVTPYAERVEAGVQLLNTVFPLWPFMARRARCREGVDILDQVFRIHDHDRPDVVLDRLGKLLGERCGPNGYISWWYQGHGFHRPNCRNDGNAIDRVRAKFQGRIWWRRILEQRSKLIAELGAPPSPWDLVPPIPSCEHDYIGKPVSWNHSSDEQMCGITEGDHEVLVPSSASIFVPWHVSFGDSEDVIDGDILLHDGFGPLLRWRIISPDYATGYIDSGSWRAQAQLLPLSTDWPVK